MSDVLERLKRWAGIQADGSQIGADLREAVAEIEQLRGVAGAVSPGVSFSDIKATAGRVPQPVDPAANETSG